MNPLRRFALPHAEQASLDHLERVGLQIDQNKQEPRLGCREWTIRVHGKPASGPGFPIEPPRRHMGLERGLKGWDQVLTLVQGQAGEIQELRRAGLQVREP